MEISHTAQLTAVLRSMDEEVSQDTLAKYFISNEAITIGKKYLTEIDPFSVRRVALRNRYIESIIKQIITTNCQVVYLASGLNSTAYRLKELNSCKVIEVDLNNMIDYKQEKINGLCEKGIITESKNIVYLKLDLNNTSKLFSLLKEHLSADKKTIFILEGIIYYLEKSILKNIIELAKENYKNCLFIVDYWPSGKESDPVYKKMSDLFSLDFKETFKSLYSQEELRKLFSGFKCTDKSFAEIEPMFCKDTLLTGRADYVDAKIFYAYNF